MDKSQDQPPPYTAFAGVHVQQPPSYSVPPPGNHTFNPPPVAPPPGYQTYNPPPVGPGYGSTVIISPQLISVGGCPACRVGILEDDFTCLGIFCAIFFFPIGILCCLALKNRRCTNCRANFG